MAITPVHFFSHGSTMMLGEESESAEYWKKCGDEAVANGIKGVIMMVSQLFITLPLKLEQAAPLTWEPSFSQKRPLTFQGYRAPIGMQTVTKSKWPRTLSPG